jgi:hypothetical protein
MRAHAPSLNKSALPDPKGLEGLAVTAINFEQRRVCP